MICGLEIGLAIFGLIALVRGKMTLTKNKIVVGIPARLLGLIALAPFPIFLLVGVAFGVMNANAPDPEKVAKDNQGLFTAIEVGVVILTAIVVFAVGAMVAVSPAEAKRRERGDRYDDEYEDDEYERPRRRGSRDDEEDEDRPRRPARGEDEDGERPPRRRGSDDGDEDDRPRRRRDDRDDDEDDRDRDRKPWAR